MLKMLQDVLQTSFIQSLCHIPRKSFTGLGCVENSPDGHMVKAGWFIHGWNISTWPGPFRLKFKTWPRSTQRLDQCFPALWPKSNVMHLQTGRSSTNGHSGLSGSAYTSRGDVIIAFVE